MAATSFSELYDLVRVHTGNDDPTVGAETLPDSRIDVLLKTGALTFQFYSEDLPALVLASAANDPDGAPDGPTHLVVALSSTPTAALPALYQGLLACAAAHKYFVGIGNKVGIEEMTALISGGIELFANRDAMAVNEADLAAASIWKTRKTAEATGQKNLR